MDPLNMLELMETADWKGFRETHGCGPGADYARRMDSFMGLMENRDGLRVDRWRYEITEAMTTSDFANLFGDAVARDLLSHYKAVQPNMERILRKRPGIHDLTRTIKTFRKGGFVTMRMQKVAEKAEYLAAEYDVEQTTYKLAKYGKQVDFAWEAFLADDLGLFSQLGQDLATASVNTRQHHITSLFFTAAGPTAAVFGNAAASTAALTIGNLETAVQEMRAFRHPDTNEPIMNAPKFLVVPPGLEFTARQILTSANKMWLRAGDADVGPLPFPTTNVIGSIGLELIVNDWQPFIDTTTPLTAWSLYSDPAQIAVGEFATMAGHEGPQIWLKSADAVQLGGGEVSPFSGDFKTDNVFYRIRDVFQGKAVETRAAWASTGTG